MATYELDGSKWKEIGGFDMMDIGRKQYGDNFVSLKHDRSNAFSWAAVLKNGSTGGLDLQSFLKQEDTKKRYNANGVLRPHSNDSRDSYSWCVLEKVSTVVTQQTYDVFLSHKQTNGGFFALFLKMEIEKRKPGCKVFLDVDDLNQLHSLEDIVKGSKNFLFLLTDGALERPWCQKEIEFAIKSNKNIILVWDSDGCSFPNPNNFPNNEYIHKLLLVKAVRFIRDIDLRNAALETILAKLV